VAFRLSPGSSFPVGETDLAAARGARPTFAFGAGDEVLWETAMLTVDRFEQRLHAWATERSDRFQFLWPLKGGWEGWIQVDVMAFLLARYGTDDVLREQSIYSNAKQRVDLILNMDAMEDRSRIPVEIKAQSMDNRDAFVPGVHKDMLKLRTKRRPDFQGCECLMVGLCFEQNAYDQLRSMTNSAGRKIFYALYETRESAVLVAQLQSNDEWKARPR
jgi:hypothetical protein